MTSLASTLSDSGGNFVLNAATGGVPIDGFARASKDSYLTSWLYLPDPLSMSFTNVPVVMIASSNVGLLELLLGVSVDDSKGVVALRIADCAGDPIAGATVSTSPAGTDIAYTSGGLPSTMAAATDADGVAIVFNVPPGDVEVQASYGGTALHAHTVVSHAGDVTQTIIHP